MEAFSGVITDASRKAQWRVKRIGGAEGSYMIKVGKKIIVSYNRPVWGGQRTPMVVKEKETREVEKSEELKLKEDEG